MLTHDPRWDVPLLPQARRGAPALSLRESLPQAGNRFFSMDAFMRSEYGQKYLDGLAPLFLSDDPMDGKVLDYWRQRGLRKTRLWGGPQPWNEWILFTPWDAGAEATPSRRYPLLIGLHGGGAGPEAGEPLFFAESSGYARKAAQEGLILALPEDHSAEGILRLVDYMRAHYPVDPGRIYLAGYSAGGDRACAAALRRPELFAGICVGAGLPFSLRRDEGEIARAGRCGIPMIAVGCLQDKGNHTPMCQTNPLDRPVPDFVARLLTAEGKIQWVNTFFAINGIPCYSLSEIRRYLQAAGTPEEKRLGLRAQRAWSYDWAGAKHLCLDYQDAQGRNTVRYVFIEGLPHTEPVDMMDIAWPFLRRFSRSDSGVLVMAE